jgi:drug/metabolite transporter (DMT)-like permease
MAALFLGERLGAVALIGTLITLSATVLIMKYDPGAA